MDLHHSLDQIRWENSSNEVRHPCLQEELTIFPIKKSCYTSSNVVDDIRDLEEEIYSQDGLELPQQEDFMPQMRNQNEFDFRFKNEIP